MIDDAIRCDHYTRAWNGLGFTDGGHRCNYRRRFRVRGNPDRSGREQVSIAGEFPCGLHVRPYLMDNGDSVRPPWIVERLEAA